MTAASGIVYRSYRLVSGLRYWVQQRMTIAGMTVLGAFMVTGTMAVDTENNISYQGFTLLFFILMVSSIFGWRFRFGLRWPAQPGKGCAPARGGRASTDRGRRKQISIPDRR